jgi:hypothetical protein
VIGIVEDGARVHEARLDILRGGAVIERIYPETDFKFSRSALRTAGGTA